MRPLYHPHPSEISVQGLLYALSDATRVRIFISLLDSDCARNCSAFLHVCEKPLPKSTLSQHFKILREAGLIRSERRGVEVHNSVHCEDLQRFMPMIKSIIEAYQAELLASPHPSQAARADH